MTGALPLLRRIHRWIGLLVAIPVALQGLSGAILALEPVWPVQYPVQQVRANDMLAIARAKVGETARVVRYVPPSATRPAAEVQVAIPGGGQRLLRIDPARRAVIGDGKPGDGAFAWVRSLHVQFLAPESGGRGIGGWAGIGLTLLLLTGVPIWWPRAGAWRAALTVPRDARGIRLHRRLHGALGAWVGVILLLLAVTGVLLAFPRTSRAVLGLPNNEAPRAPTDRAAALGSGGDPDLDRAVGLARQAAPDAILRMALLPAGADGPIRIFMTHAGREGAAAAITVQVDPTHDRVVSVQDADRMPLADRAWRQMHDLHAGAGFGAAWRLLIGLAGVCLPVFAVTGPAMWWLRQRRRPAAARPRAVAETR